MRRFQPRLLFIVLAFYAIAVAAADIDQAKSDGLIGERADGYIGFVIDAVPADTVELVREINGKRRTEYQRIAEANGIPLEQVEALAGKKAIEKTPDGAWILTNGGWRRK